MAGACFSQKSTMCQGFCLSPLAGVRNRVVSAWQELTGWAVCGNTVQLSGKNANSLRGPRCPG